MLTRNFSRDELKCPCCNACNMSPILLDRLQILRDILDRPMTINSGFRCKKHNTEINGTFGSQHLLGNAADISIVGWSDLKKNKLYKLVDSLEFHGFGKYPTFVHLDTRTGPIARW